MGRNLWTETRVEGRKAPSVLSGVGGSGAKQRCKETGA